MQRATITLDDEFVTELDSMISRRGYQNRSEAIRDLARAGMRQAAEGSQETGNCIAALVYVYDHESRDLSKRLTHVFHDHHELTHSAMHVHLDHGSCMEVAVLRGEAKHVRHLADHVIAERGVRHGQLNIITVEAGDAHGPAAGKFHHHHGHLHLIPRS